MSSSLFSPFDIGGTTLQNRIIVSPMCQYSAENGVAGDWHIMHIGQFATANPGLIFLEGTAVSPEGRITPYDLCLYNEAQKDGIARVVSFVKAHSDTRIGIQLFHAGRKGSQYRPWDKGTEYGGGDMIAPKDGGWDLSAPSAMAYSDEFACPRELSLSDLDTIKLGFVKSAKLALDAGIDTVELHYAHGYLLHSFLSPISNTRSDIYGGSERNRMRFPLEVFKAVRNIWPHDKPLGARISGSDFGTSEHGNTVENAISFAQALVAEGCDYLDVSGGFLSPDQDFMSAYGPGFQVKLAQQVKAAVNVPVFSVGVISGAQQAEDIIKHGQADAVALARGMLYDPRWPWHAAYKLGVTPKFPPQYERTFSFGYPEMFESLN